MFRAGMIIVLLAIGLMTADTSQGQVTCGPLQRFAGNLVLQAGSCGWVNSPAVLVDGGSYVAWFACGRNSIHRATSPDGVVWSDQGEVLRGFCGWNGFDVYAPFVIKVGATYHMWLNGSNGSTPSIGHAASPDGISWTQDCAPIFVHALDPTVHHDGLSFTMWFGEQGGLGRIMRSVSPDGVSWSPPAPVMCPSDAWEVGGLAGPTVTRLDGQFFMWYHSFGTGGTSSSIGQAQSPDGVSWIKCPNNPVLAPSGGGFESAFVFGPAVIQAGADVRVYYAGATAADNNGAGIGFATAAVPANRLPDCGLAAASPSLVWPPDGSLVPVAVMGVTDPDGDPVSVSVTGVTQDELLDSHGDGRSCPDAVIERGGASVRAERAGTGSGRVYTIIFTASDGRGGTCDGSADVCVPHDDGPAPTCVRDALAVNSLGACDPAAGELSPADVHLLVLEAGRSRTLLEYSLPNECEVALSVYDIAGRRVADVENSRQRAGNHQVAWSAAGLARGMYFVRLRAGSQIATRALIVTW